MNTGLQDAYNLAWKLALVAQGEAGDTLLDSYEAERLPIARRLLETTDRGFRVVVSDAPFAGLLRTRVLARLAAFAMGRESVQKLAFRTVSQTGIHYRAGPLATSSDELPAEAPQAGDRFPWLQLRLDAQGPVEDLFERLEDTHFHLIAFGQALPSEPLPAFSNLLHVHAMPAGAANDAELEHHKIPLPSFYLVRPDGYIGLCGRRLEAAAVARYAAQRLRLG